MNYLLVLKLLSLLLLVDLGSAAEKAYKSYSQILNGIDWRQYGTISPVQDVGDCLASWAIAAAGAVEAHLAIKNRRLVELSAQQLIDCSSYPNQGCNGGWPSVAFNYTRDHGIASKASYPYRSQTSACSYDPSTRVGGIKGYALLRVDEKQLAEIVYNIGPVVVSIDSLHESYYSYAGGVYREPKCRLDLTYHMASVLVVGFGKDEQFGDYWILKNSLGESWGENGYMRLARNAGNMCGVATLALYPIV